MIPELLQAAVFHLDLSILLVISNTAFIWILIFSLCLLIIGSALVSGSEVAYFSLSPDDLHNLGRENSRSGNMILGLRSNPRKLLATILISNNLINIAIVIFSHFLVEKLIAPEILLGWGTWISDLFGGLWIGPERAGYMINFLITVVGVTFILVLFGEVAPKIYAKLNNIKLSKLMSGPFVFLNGLFTPISAVLVSSSNLIEKRLKNRHAGDTSRDWKEIDSAIELAMSAGSQSDSEIDLLKSILKFSEVSVTQIMTPRVDVVAIDQSANFEEVMELSKSSTYSRIPVYSETFDNVTGILYVKDLIRYVDMPSDFNWQQFIRTDILYAPESKKISDLLQEIQEEKMHMAIVVDEYGGSSGVATLEDIMEEIVGEIRDEFEEEDEIEYMQVDENTYIFEGKVLLNDVLRIIDENPDYFDKYRGDADSMAGLILELTGKMPKINFELKIGKYLMRVMGVNKRRIEQVRVTRLEK